MNAFGLSTLWLYILAFSAVLTLVVSLILDRKNRNVWEILAVTVFVPYLLFVLALTILDRVPSASSFQLTIFSTYGEAKNDKAVRDLIIANYLLYVPMGFLLPVLLKKFFKDQNKESWALMIPFCVSVCLELLQLLLKRGVFSLDDIMGNTIGGFIGYWLWWRGGVMKKQRQELKERQKEKK